MNRHTVELMEPIRKESFNFPSLMTRDVRACPPVPEKPNDDIIKPKVKKPTSDVYLRKKPSVRGAKIL